MRPGGLRTELIYETTISTIEGPAETAAWLSRPQLEQEREGHSGQSPPGRAQALDPGITGRRMAASTPQRLPFNRAARIKQGRDFARVRRVGERLVNGCLIANWQRLPENSASRLGVITGGRIGGAVVRNRARRLMRETFRLHQHELAGPVDLVLVGRPSIAGKGFAQVERDFLITLRKAKLLKSASAGVE
jgi:ribonuclease P protein component